MINTTFLLFDIENWPSYFQPDWVNFDITISNKFYFFKEREHFIDLSRHLLNLRLVAERVLSALEFNATTYAKELDKLRPAFEAIVATERSECPADITYEMFTNLNSGRFMELLLKENFIEARMHDLQVYFLDIKASAIVASKSLFKINMSGAKTLSPFQFKSIIYPLNKHWINHILIFNHLKELQHMQVDCVVAFKQFIEHYMHEPIPAYDISTINNFSILNESSSPYFNQIRTDEMDYSSFFKNSNVNLSLPDVKQEASSELNTPNFFENNLVRGNLELSKLPTIKEEDECVSLNSPISNKEITDSFKPRYWGGERVDSFQPAFTPELIDEKVVVSPHDEQSEKICKILECDVEPIDQGLILCESNFSSGANKSFAPHPTDNDNLDSFGVEKQPAHQVRTQPKPFENPHSKEFWHNLLSASKQSIEQTSKVNEAFPANIDLVKTDAKTLLKYLPPLDKWSTPNLQVEKIDVESLPPLNDDDSANL